MNLTKWFGVVFYQNQVSSIAESPGVTAWISNPKSFSIGTRFTIKLIWHSVSDNSLFSKLDVKISTASHQMTADYSINLTESSFTLVIVQKTTCQVIASLIGDSFFSITSHLSLQSLLMGLICCAFLVHIFIIGRWPSIEPSIEEILIFTSACLTVRSDDVRMSSIIEFHTS